MTGVTAYDAAVAPLAGQAPAANDKYDEAIQGLADDRDSRVRASVFGASGVNPEQAVRARKIAERTGAAPDAVLRNLPAAERTVGVEDVVANTADTPVLRDSYADPYFAQVAGKESGVMARVEKTVKSYLDPQSERSKGMQGGKVVVTPSQFADRVHQVKESNPALDWATATQLAGQGVTFDNSPGGISESRRPEVNTLNLLSGAISRIYEGFKQFDANASLIAGDVVGIDNKDRVQKLLAASEHRTYLNAPEPSGYAASQLYSGAVGGLAQIPGILLTGGGSLAPVLSSFFLSSGAQAYGTTRMRGGTAAESALSGVLQGGLEVATELLPMKFAIAGFGKMGLGDFLAGFAGRELGSEWLNTLASNAVDTAIANPNKSWADYLSEQPKALLDTTLQVLGTAGTLGVVSKGLAVTAMRAQSRQYEVDKANERGAMLGELFNVAAGANVKKLDANTFGEFVQKVADSADSPLANVHVDATILADTLKQSGVDMDAFAQMSPTAAKELTEALQSGGSVAIPIGDLVGKMGDSGIEQALLPHLRATEDGLSLEEAKVEQETAQDFLMQESTRVMQQAADFQVTEASAEAVRNTMFAQLQATGRFAPDVNKAYSTLVGSFYTVLGNNLGVTPEQAYAQFPLRVQEVGVEQEGYKQPEDVAEAEQLRGVIGDQTLAELQAALLDYADTAAPSTATPEQMTQAKSMLEPLMAKAAAAKPGFDATVQRIADKVGIQARIPGIKKMPRAASKLATELDFDVTRMRDLVRATIVVDKVEDVQKAIDEIGANFEIVRVKNRFDAPTEAGYRDVLINVKLPNGIDAEVQVNIPAMIIAKSHGHKLYARSRGMTDGEAKTQLEALQSRVYGDAFSAAQNAISAASARDALLRKTSGGKGLPLSANTTEPSASLNTGTPSTSNTTAPSGTLNIGTSLDTPIVADATMSDFTQESLPELLSKDNWAVLTAADPGATKQSDAANAVAMASLRQDLNDLGVTYTEAVGKYGDTQPSFIVTGIPERVAAALGNKYGQESILTRKGLIYQDGSITPATGIDVFDTPPEDFYTEVPDTGAFFSVQLDFERRVQPDGVEAYAQSLSARVPSAVGSVNDINKVALSDLAALQEAPTLLAKIATRLGEAASLLKRRLKDPDALLDAYIGQMADNLTWIYDQVPPDIRERSKLWYDGARALVDRVVAKYAGAYTAPQISGVYAVMSPQMDWFQNVTLGDRIIDVWSDQQDTAWTPEMSKALRATAASNSPEVVEAIEGKTLRQLERDDHRAFWIVAYDLAYNPRTFHVVTPEGEFADLARNADGRPMKGSWANGFGPVAKAVSVLRDGSLENISDMLGKKHKVRNFYNNIFDPKSPKGFVTSDTHAVAAALLLPLSGSSPEVMDNFGAAGSNAASGIFGSYPAYVEAYTRATAAINARDGTSLLPREMQSITWEALRGMFTPAFKSKYNSKKDSTTRDAFDGVWKDYHAGKRDIASARAAILELAGGIIPPDWHRPAGGGVGPRWSASYAGELLAPGGADRAADRGARGLAAAGTTEPTGGVEDTATQVEQRRMRQAVDLAVLQAKPSESDTLAQTAAGEKPGQIALTGVHFSTKPGLNHVNGRYYGTGLKGAEKERIRNSADTRLAARTYFYIDEGKGVRPEAGVGGNAHEAQLSNLYDINADPLKLIVGGNTNATESNILDAGFDGYYVRDAFNQQGAAVVIGPASYAIPVTPIANPTSKAQPLPPAAPPVYKRGLMSSELNKINIDAIKVVAPSARISAGNFQVLQSEAQAAAAVAAMQGINLPVEYAQGEGTRGTFSPKSLTITLLENADLTTFLHETGHFMLEAMASVTNRVDAPAGMREDMSKLLDWFGVKDMQTWMSLSTDGKRQYHEKFAESFEQYLFEGKAPSVELQGVFRRFRSWMQHVYRSLTDFMRSHNTQLNDEVRQVFDRMLATDEAITQAEDAAGMFADPDATAMAMEKLTARSLRDLKWTINARAKAIKALQHQAAQLRTAVKAEVQAEVDDMPVFRAREALAALKTDAEHGVDTIPQEEAIAAANGYTGVDHMLHDVLRAGGKAATVEAMVDNRMLERYGDLIDQRAIEKAANEEVHNEARARSLATELAAQTAALNAREDTGKTNAGGARMTVNVLMKAAKHFASNVIGRTTVRELPGRSRQHLAAERRAGKAWQKATAAGATEDAIRAKKDQVLNNAASREAMLAADEVAKTIDYFKKFDKDTVRAKMPQDYLDQIDRLLEAIDLRKSTTNRDIDRRQSLREWVDAQHALGLDPVLPDYLLDGMRQTSYKELTVDEIRGLKDTIKNIEHLGRLKGKLLKAKDQREFDVIADEIAASIREHGGKELPVQLEPDGKVKQFFKGAWADHRKLNSLVHQMDGGKDNGPFYRALVRSMNDSGAQEGVMLEEATMALADIFKPVEALPGGLAGGEVFIPEIKNTLTRSGRLSIALNWGNTQNRQRITGGDGWTTMQAEAILRTLNRTELEFVNKVWEHIDSYWPAIKAKQLRVSGVVEDKVDAEPFEVVIDTPNGAQTVQMRGGYYPIKYDSDRSIRAEKNEAVEKAMDIMRGAFMRPTTRRGHTKARVDEVNGRPLRKDLAALTQHVSQVAHDLAWHEWFIDANRLMNDSRIQGAIRDHYGPETARAMRDAINAIAVGDAVHQGQIDQLLLRMRSAVTRSIMGFSLTTALLQPFGLTQSMARIGVVPVLKGAARWAGDAMHMESTVGWVAEKSDFMRLRNKTFNRELREINQRLHGKSTFARIADASLFMAMQKMQMVADIPTWVGQYEKMIAAGVDESAAIALADEAVLASQGGGTTKDLSAVQRDMPFMTQFYSYFNTTMNLVAEKTGQTDFKNPRAVAGWLGDMALLTVIPSILPAMITFLLKGGGDDDPEKWAKRMLDWYASYMFGMFVGLRELPTLWSPFSYAGPPAAKLINDGRRLVQQAEQGEIDDKAVLAVIGFMGTAIGLPTSQMIRSYKGWQAWDEGKAPPTAMLFGPPPKD